MKVSMKGHLEPSGKLAAELGGQAKIDASVEKFCTSLRKLIEKSATNTAKYFDGTYPRNNMQLVLQQSEKLSK